MNLDAELDRIDSDLKRIVDTIVPEARPVYRRLRRLVDDNRDAFNPAQATRISVQARRLVCMCDPTIDELRDLMTEIEAHGV